MSSGDERDKYQGSRVRVSDQHFIYIISHSKEVFSGIAHWLTPINSNTPVLVDFPQSIQFIPHAIAIIQT